MTLHSQFIIGKYNGIDLPSNRHAQEKQSAKLVHFEDVLPVFVSFIDSIRAAAESPDTFDQVLKTQLVNLQTFCKTHNLKIDFTPRTKIREGKPFMIHADIKDKWR